MMPDLVSRCMRTASPSAIAVWKPMLSTTYSRVTFIEFQKRSSFQMAL